MENTIIHRTPQGTYALDYRQGEAVRLRLPYTAPRVDTFAARVESGYALSGHQPQPPDAGITEGITDRVVIFV